LGRPLSPVLVYDHPTIDALAQFLASDQGSEAGAEAADAVLSSDLNRLASGIAVIGIGCRFPGADGSAAFWRLLRDGVDAITEVPADRWNHDEVVGWLGGSAAHDGPVTDQPPNHLTTQPPKFGGFLEAVDRFDRAFFGIAPREAERMDPQQRL